MDFSLKGKVVLITGASRGIGEAAAIGLAQAGADIAIASRKLPDLEKVARAGAKNGKEMPARSGPCGQDGGDQQSRQQGQG